MPSLLGNRRPLGSAPAGMVWSDTHGGYVSPTTTSSTNATNATNAATTAQANATASTAQPRSMAELQLLQNQVATSAPGYTAPMSEAEKAAAALGTSTLTEKQREAQAAEALAQAKFDATRSMREKLMGSLDTMFATGPGGTTPGGQPGQPGPGGVDDAVNAAEQAALTSAKERGGERLAGSLKGLHELMAERGISGSGLEAKGARELYGDYLHGQNDTERGIIQGRAARAQANANAQWERQNQIADRDFAAQQGLVRDKINALLSTFGMSY